MCGQVRGEVGSWVEGREARKGIVIANLEQRKRVR